MGHYVGLGDVISLLGSRDDALKAPTILWVFKALQYIADSGLIYTIRVNQNKQITTSKDKMKDCQLEDEKKNVLLLQK